MPMDTGTDIIMATIEAITMGTGQAMQEADMIPVMSIGEEITTAMVIIPGKTEVVLLPEIWTVRASQIPRGKMWPTEMSKDPKSPQTKRIMFIPIEVEMSISETIVGNGVKNAISHLHRERLTQEREQRHPVLINLLPDPAWKSHTTIGVVVI